MPATTGRTRQEAELGGGVRGQAAEHAARRDELGQLGPLEPGQVDERVVVGDRPDVAVVRHPVQGDGVVRRPGQPGEAQVEVVDRLEEDRRRGVDVGALPAQEVDVADRVLARQARDAAGAAHPLGQLGGGVALDVQRTAHRLADGAGAPGVHPGDGRADGGTTGVDGHGARPLGGAADADDVAGGHPAVGQRLPGRRHDGVPPGLRGLLRSPIVGEINSDRLEGVGHDPAGGRQNGHLRTAGTEVDGQHVWRRRFDGADLGGRCGRHGESAYRARPARFRAGL